MSEERSVRLDLAGLLAATARGHPGRADARRVALAVHAYAHVVVANRRFSDLFACDLRRSH